MSKNIEWLTNKNKWKGECPLCGLNSFYVSVWEHTFGNEHVNILECTEGHPFMVSFRLVVQPDRQAKRDVEYITPVSGDTNVPSWLPDGYKGLYYEMNFDFKSKKWRSAIAIASIILDTHVNSLLKNPGERKKPLAARLEILQKFKLITPDEFSEATIGRLSRNEVLHPEKISEKPITEEDASTTIEAVLSCLERFYKWRISKALPAPKDQVESVQTQ